MTDDTREILQRIDQLAISLNDLFRILNAMQHPEQSCFGPAPKIGQTQAQRSDRLYLTANGDWLPVSQLPTQPPAAE